ncbi:MAG: hypothetical protein ACI9VR_005358 [Cognaticolwellia sp.]|jgi:hypothetical protein
MAELDCLAELGLLQSAPSSFVEGERDSFGTENSTESEHLILRWDGSLDPALSQVILASGEESWQSLVVELGMAEPYGSSSYKLNIYLGDSGANAPRALGEAYATVDGDGYPMVVLSPEAVSDWERGQVVLAHEFFHTLQDNSAAPFDYAQESPGAWLFEATAVWAEAQVYPGNADTARWTYGWSLRPQDSVDRFAFPSSGSLEEYRQYGAFLWVRFLSDQEGQALIPALWGQGADDPRLALDHALDLESAWHDFALRGASWDFLEGARYAAVHAQAAERWPDWDERLSALQAGNWQELPVPDSMGVRYLGLDADSQRLRVRAPDGGALRVQLSLTDGDQDLGWAPVDHRFDTALPAQAILVLSSGWEQPAQGLVSVRTDSPGGCGGCKSGGSGGVLGALLAVVLVLTREREWSC